MNKKEKNILENKVFFDKFFNSFFWRASGITVKDSKYNELNRLEKMCFLRDKVIKSSTASKISKMRLTKGS